MKTGVINRVCYAICVLSISGAFVTGLLMIWTELSDESMWKLLMTFLVMLLAAGGMIAVTRAVAPRSRADE